MQDRPSCYIASPLGFSEAGRYYYGQILLPALEKLIEPVDPWALVTDREVAAAVDTGNEREMAVEIGRRNREALESCRLLVAVLDGQEIDSGTAAEIGYASALGLTCLGLRTDRRQTGEVGARINLQVEAFLAISGGAIADSLDELLASLRATIDSGIAESASA